MTDPVPTRADRPTPCAGAGPEPGRAGPARPRLGVLVGHLPTYLAAEHGTVERGLAHLRGVAARLGADLVEVAEPVTDAAGAGAAAARLADADVDLVVVLHATFTMGEVTRAALGAGHRLVAWSLEEPRTEGDIPLNGFVSAHLGAGLATLDQPDRPALWMFGTDRAWCEDRLADALDTTRLRRALGSATVGLVGGIAPGFDTFAVDHAALAARHGTRVVERPLAEVIERGQAAEVTEVAEVVTRLGVLAEDRTSVPAHVEANARLAVGLADLARDEGLAALAVSDWPEAQERLGIHPGMALSYLGGALDIPAACEGDVMGALSMLALRTLTGRGAALLDVATIDPGSDAALLWHCGGSPIDLADGAGARWVDHSTLGRGDPTVGPVGAVADLVIAPGPVTIARLDRHGARATVLEAEVVPGPSRGFDGTRGWVTAWRDHTGTDLELPAVVDALLREGVDHHLALVPGSVATGLAAWCRDASVTLVPSVGRHRSAPNRR